MATNENDVQFNLRIPRDLKERVIESSRLSRRSINAEAAWLLDDSLSAANEMSDDKRVIKILLARIDELEKAQVK